MTYRPIRNTIQLKNKKCWRLHKNVRTILPPLSTNLSVFYVKIETLDLRIGYNRISLDIKVTKVTELSYTNSV